MSLEEIKAEAFKAFQTKQYDLAVELFGKACGTYAEAHDGQEDPDLLFEYGNALFHLGRANVSLLNTENVDNTSKPMERELDPTRIELAPMEELEVVPEGEKTSKELAAERSKVTKEAEEVTSESKTTGSEEISKEEPAQEDAQEAQDVQEAQNAQEDADGDAQDGDDDADEFTAAWQMIDLCRVLYSRELDLAKEKAPLNRKLAKVYALLGEISIEDDNYDQAADDFASALAIKKELYEPTDRLLSEAHYMLALAQEMKGDSDKEAALSNMQAAVDIAKKAGVDSQSIQDLRQKVHDLKKDVEALKNAPAPVNDDPTAALKGMMEMLGGAQDIGGLVKRKKKQEPQPESQAESTAESQKEKPVEKKAKLE